jgi:hypothetical protein
MFCVNPQQHQPFVFVLLPQVLPADMSLEDTSLFYARAGVAAYDASVAAYKVRPSP